MPHINRIRVNNVKYNFGTQYYDDFVLRLSGKNTIYDLLNGGGKSVLMLLLLQNMLPNCTLDEKQPVEKLFRSGNNNTVIHSLIEWRLNDSDVKNQYKYMTTGFCARKAQKDTPAEDEVRDTASIEYFNYCIFYREFNDNDIVNLPLADERERISYNGLKSYLRSLEKKDYSLEIKIFERRGDYQRFISRYGIYESEWEIIRGINKTEGHVRTYFETNYRTTRRVVEDLFIDEIIEKSFRNKIAGDEDKEDMMAKTLIDIKDKLVELSLKNSEIQNFDRQMELLSGFAAQLDGLEGAYAKSDGAKNILLGIYDYVKKAEEEKLKEKEQLVDERLLLQDRLTTAKRLLDTAKISIEENRARKLEAELSQKEEDIVFSEDKLSKLKEELNYKESANDYLDYIYYAAGRDRLKAELDNVTKDKGELSELLSGLASLIKELTDKELTELSGEAMAQEKELTETSEELKNAEFKEREADKEAAILTSRINDTANNVKSTTLRYSELQVKADILLGTTAADIKALAEEQIRLINEGEAEAQKVEERYAKLHDLKLGERINFEKLGEQISRLNIEVRKNAGIVEEQKEDKKRIFAMKSAYNVRDLATLKEVLLKHLDDNGEKWYELASAKKLLMEELDAYDEGLLMPKTAKRERFRDYIERCYGCSLQYGEDYVLSVGQEERERLIVQHPLLLFGFVADDGLELFASDEKLAGERLQDYPIPVFLKSALESDDFEEMDKVVYPNKLSGWYTGNGMKEIIIREASEKLSVINEKLKKLEGQRRAVYDDYDFINYYISIYGEDGDLAWEEYERANAELERVKTEKDELLLHIQAHENEEQLLLKKLSELKEEKQRLMARAEYIKELLTCQDELERLETLSEELTISKNKSLKQQRELKAYIGELTVIKDAGLERFNNINNRILKLGSDWEELYKPFYKGEACKDMSLGYDEAVLKFAGIRNAFDKEYAGLEDKRQLINNYEYAMSKSLQAIAYSGISEELLRTEYEAHRLVKAEKNELLLLRDAISREQSSLKLLQREAGSARDEKNRIEGGVSHAIKAVIEKYGVYEEIAGAAADMQGKPEQFAAARKKEVEELSGDLLCITEKLKEFEEGTRDFELMKKELERIFKSESIVISAEEASKSAVLINSATADISVLYDRTLKEFDSLRKEIYERREDFERAKSRLIEVLIKLEAHGLATELREHVTVPVTLAELAELSLNIDGTISCIRLEKERVMRGIEDMQAIKDNFENQCLQTCENIRIELDKLSKLSTIRMDDELISVISLKIPYEPEENRKSRMAAYIDELVAKADTIDNQPDRLKYIRGGLSWKRLFAVIVTDMNAIKLNLYKRERIKEQSRYLKYEEAVGSTGQSQGIYIQFLIGVINYIANINSPDAHTGLRKVIFIDNPFGAAKDIYIWEPIFKLLKTNNVQLIVPARGATPAITGRFDVNYVLGQKLIGGRQQTVVVDYFSSVARESLEYTAINYEQTALEL